MGLWRQRCARLARERARADTGLGAAAREARPAAVASKESKEEMRKADGGGAFAGVAPHLQEGGHGHLAQSQLPGFAVRRLGALAAAFVGTVCVIFGGRTFRELWVFQETGSVAQRSPQRSGRLLMQQTAW